MDILSLFVCLELSVPNATIRQLARIIEAIFVMSGPVTMLAISRFTDKGGSYRTVQRFFNTKLPWLNILWLFFRHHLYRKDEVYLLVGDETVVTKSGKQTHGVDRFFSSLQQRPVSGLAFFALSLVGVKESRSYPVSVKQIVKTQEEKDAAKARKQNKKTKKQNTKHRAKGRPIGSKNKEKNQIRFSPLMCLIDSMIGPLLHLIGSFIPLDYLVMDGAFGNNQAMLLARKYNLHLISKLRCDSALYEQYSGPYSGTGPCKLYGDKLNMKNLPAKYLKKKVKQGQMLTKYYQLVCLHKEFFKPLNVVIIVKTNMKTKEQSNVILLSSDLKLNYEKLIEYYRLRFQIEFNFREAKQHWGLEDFMNVKETGVTNAVNLSFLLVSVSSLMLKKNEEGLKSVLDLKSYYRAMKYVRETIKMLVKKPEPILIERIKEGVGSLGRIHTGKVTVTVT